MPACKKILGKAPDEKWTGEDRTEVLSLYNWVKKAFLAHGGARLQCTVGDVLLLLLRVYTKEELANLSPSELSESSTPCGTMCWPCRNRTPCRSATSPPPRNRPACWIYPARQAYRAQPFEGCLCA